MFRCSPLTTDGSTNTPRSRENVAQVILGDAERWALLWTLVAQGRADERGNVGTSSFTPLFHHDAIVTWSEWFWAGRGGRRRHADVSRNQRCHYRSMSCTTPAHRLANHSKIPVSIIHLCSGWGQLEEIRAEKRHFRILWQSHGSSWRLNLGSLTLNVLFLLMQSWNGEFLLFNRFLLFVIAPPDVQVFFKCLIRLFHENKSVISFYSSQFII